MKERQRGEAAQETRSKLKSCVFNIPSHCLFVVYLLSCFIFLHPIFARKSLHSITTFSLLKINAELYKSKFLIKCFVLVYISLNYDPLGRNAIKILFTAININLIAQCNCGLFLKSLKSRSTLTLTTLFIKLCPCPCISRLEYIFWARSALVCSWNLCIMGQPLRLKHQTSINLETSISLQPQSLRYALLRESLSRNTTQMRTQTLQRHTTRTNWHFNHILPARLCNRYERS
jgi:hypothetical protein